MAKFDKQSQEILSRVFNSTLGRLVTGRNVSGGDAGTFQAQEVLNRVFESSPHDRLRMDG